MKTCLYKREAIKLQIWDTSGRQQLKHSMRMGGGNGVLVMFSVGNRQSFDNVTWWLKQVDQDFTNIVLAGLRRQRHWLSGLECATQSAVPNQGKALKMQCHS